MRITFVSPVGEVGGAERVMLGLAAHLRPRHQTAVVLMADGPIVRQLLTLEIPHQIAALPARLQRAGEQQTTLASTLGAVARAPIGMLAYRRYLRELRAALASTAPEVVHTHGIKAHLAAASAKPPGAKLVWHMHDYLSNRGLSRHLLRAYSSRADLLVAVSRSVATDVAAALPGRPVVNVPNFTDTRQFCSAAVNASMLDMAAGLPPAPPQIVRVGLVATYAVWKGHHLFLKAAARAIERLGRNRLRAYVVGGPIYSTAGKSQVSESELRRTIDELGLNECIGLVPFQSDPAPVYQALDICVHASTRPEPFGLTIIEAMACERAVVVAEAGGAAEIVTDERDGLYYPPGDVEALAGAISRLADDANLRRRLGEAARATVLANYQAESAAAAMNAAYGAIYS